MKQQQNTCKTIKLIHDAAAANTAYIKFINTTLVLCNQTALLSGLYMLVLIQLIFFLVLCNQTATIKLIIRAHTAIVAG
jgi:hypothetical protein